ncbi:MAG: Nudix family hydrolase [Burkholderiales bacterium]|nr:Nudix family hydrolase [Burkholderiales bacterium]
MNTPASEPVAVVQVVAAVIFRHDGRFLLAQRPRGKVYAGYWEFPGGKIEAGESAREALARELHEELGIEVELAYPWLTRRYSYAHATVDLNFFRVLAFRGEPHGRENQSLAWETIGRVGVEPMLPANGPILAALALPDVYAITNALECGTASALAQLDRALRRGLRLLQVREPGLSAEALGDFATEAVRRAHERAARVLVNADAALARHCGADGVHLKAVQLRSLRARPSFPLVGASCHDAEELALASRLGVDFVVVGPVAPTPSHPGAPVLGFARLAQLLTGYALPAYALGGMQLAHMQPAWASGAHGIAMQRGAWSV